MPNKSQSKWTQLAKLIILELLGVWNLYYIPFGSLGHTWEEIRLHDQPQLV